MSRCKYQNKEQRVVCYYHKSNIVTIILLKNRPRKSKGGVEVYLYSFFNLGRRWGWMVNATHSPLYPRDEDPVPIV